MQCPRHTVHKDLKVDVLILKSTGLVEGVELNEEEVKVGSPEMCKEVLQLRRGRKETGKCGAVPAQFRHMYVAGFMKLIADLGFCL